MTNLKIIFTVLIFQYVRANHRVDPLLDTKLGLIRGLRANDGAYSMFLGIPYAKVNVSNPFGITIAGESAGSMSIDFHLMFEEEKLFNNVIMESGTTSIALSVEPDKSAPINIAYELGFTTDDISNALSFLSTVDPKLVIAASSKIGNIFFPCVEKKFDGVERLISDYPVNKNIPKARGMQILIGFNSHESVPEYQLLNSAYFDFEALIKTQFQFSDNELIEMGKLVRIFYTGEKNSKIAQTQFSYFVSDFQFSYPTERDIAKFLANGADNVFHYVFSYNGGRNLIQRMENITVKGPIHADEIGYLFDIASWTEQPTEEDQLTLDRVTEMWTNFAKYGNPTPEISKLLPVKWEPITKDSVYHYFNIDAELSLQLRPYHERMAFWDLFYRMNEKLQKGYREQ